MAPGDAPYFVYILLCADGTLYVGSTPDATERQHRHNEGRGAACNASRTPVRLVYSEEHSCRLAALKREAQVKHWTRANKEALVAGNLAGLHGLARQCR